MSYWIVWNEPKTEGVVFDNEADAFMTARGYDAMQEFMEIGVAVPALGDAFAELHEGENLSVQKVEGSGWAGHQ